MMENNKPLPKLELDFINSNKLIRKNLLIGSAFLTFIGGYIECNAKDHLNSVSILCIVSAASLGVASELLKKANNSYQKDFQTTFKNRFMEPKE